MSPKSIALLVCDTPHPRIIEKHGDYSVIFRTFLTKSLLTTSNNATGAEFTVDAYDVANKMEYPTEERLDTYDSVLITGSAKSAYDDQEWIKKLVAYIAWLADAKPRIKIIGICFGHQIVALALGGTCIPNNGQWEVGPTPIELTQLGKDIFGVETLNIQEMHRDHVPTLPPNFHLLGSTKTCYNQGMVRFHPPSPALPPPRHADIHVFTMQGHPEFTEPIVSVLVQERTYNGVINEEVAADAERRRFWRDDGIAVVGKAVWGVLGV